MESTSCEFKIDEIDSLIEKIKSSRRVIIAMYAASLILFAMAFPVYSVNGIAGLVVASISYISLLSSYLMYQKVMYTIINFIDELLVEECL